MRGAKILLAICLGAPMTLFFLPWLLPAALSGAAMPLVALLHHGEVNLRASLLFAAWAGAGLCGLTGFWAWVFTDHRRSPWSACWISGLLAVGLLAIAPITVPAAQSGHPQGWLVWMALAGSALALLLSASLLWQAWRRDPAPER